MKYEWLDAYLLSLPGAEKDYKIEWGWMRYQVRGKLFAAVVDVLDEIALEVEDLTDEVMELGDGLDVISDDLGDVEDIIYDEDDDDYEELDEDEDDEEEECYATTCPECEEEIFFDDSVLEDGKVECPNCGATLEFDPEDLVEDEEEKDD